MRSGRRSRRSLCASARGQKRQRQPEFFCRLLAFVVERAAAASPYGDDHHARAAAAVELIGEYLARARGELSPISLSDDPRFVALLAAVQ